MTHPRPVTRIGRLVAVIGACLLLVTACDGSEASPPPSASTSTPTGPTTQAPSPPPTPSPPAVPQASFTVSSAEAFARFYLQAKEYAALTGDTALLRQWANKTCSTCQGLAEGYEQQYKAGGSISGDVQLRIERVERVRLLGSDGAEVVVSGRVGRFVDIDHAKAKPKVYPGGRVRWRLGLTRSNGAWLMFGMVQNP
jgi:hypothetical protein